jgi:integrase/recombinase XerC
MKLLLDRTAAIARTGRHRRAHRVAGSLAMELLYGGGLRVSELCRSITARSISIPASRACWVKGAKERLCPLGRVALTVLKKFRGRVRGARAAEPTVPCSSIRGVAAAERRLGAVEC